VLEARVTDHGRGLSPQECERVFDAYEAASASRGGGTGLGLYSAFDALRCGLMCPSKSDAAMCPACACHQSRARARGARAAT
jgi:hypothetical protein